MKKLVIIDDMPDLLKIYQNALADYYEVVCLSSATEAIDFVYQNAQDIDIVMADYLVREKNGNIILKEVSKANEHILRVLMAGENMRSEIESLEKNYQKLIFKSEITDVEFLIDIFEDSSATIKSDEENRTADMADETLEGERDELTRDGE